MSARSIWQGTLTVQKHEIAVKIYSAVEDRGIHFHLLHKRDRTRVQQRMVDSETEQPVPLDEAQKAFEAEPGLYVPVTREDIERSAPKPGREVRVSQFVPVRAIDPQLFDHPYYLGPVADSATDYFALAQALDKKKCAGIATWVMRKHSYVGALIPQHGYLMIITLRHADEVIQAGQLDPPQGGALGAKERDLAGKLVEALSGRFDPEAYKDEYHERIHELVDAKRAGKRMKAKRAVPRRTEGSLADSLLSSLKKVSAGRRAREEMGHP